MALSRAHPGIALVVAALLAVAAVGAVVLGPDPTPEQAPAVPPPAPSITAAPTRLDVHGDPLPPSAVARLGTVRFRQGGEIGQFAFAPDSKTLAAASSDGMVCLWDVATGREVRRFENAAGGGQPAVAFSPDGKVRRWDTATGAELPRFTLASSTAGQLLFSPDGRVLACLGQEPRDNQNTVVFLDAASGKELHRLAGLRNYAAPRIAFAPDSRTWAYVDRKDKAVRLHDTLSGKELRRLEGHAAEAFTVAFAPDGRTVASTDTNQVLRFWDARTGELLPRVGRLWARANLAYSPDGKVLAGGACGVPWLYDLDADKSFLAGGTWPADGDHAALFSPDGKLLVSVHGYALRLWDRSTWQPVREPAGHEQEVCSVAFAADGKTVFSAAGEDGIVRRWEAATGRPLTPLTGFRDYAYALALSPDGRTLAIGTGNNAGTVWLRDLATGQLDGKLVIPGGYVTSLAFAADGKTVASRYQNETRLWDVRAGTLLHTLRGMPEEHTDAALAPDGRTIAGGDPVTGAILVVEAATGKELKRFEGHHGGTYAVAFAPDGKTLASGGLDGTVRLWETKSGDLLWNAAGHRRWVRFVTFSPDGKTLASGGQDGSVRLWEAATGKERGRFDGHRHGVRCAAFSADGRLLATGGADTTVLVWDLASVVEVSR